MKITIQHCDIHDEQLANVIDVIIGIGMSLNTFRLVAIFFFFNNWNTTFESNMKHTT